MILAFVEYADSINLIFPPDFLNPYAASPVCFPNHYRNIFYVNLLINVHILAKNRNQKLGTYFHRDHHKDANQFYRNRNDKRFPPHRNERKLWPLHFPFGLLFSALFCPLFVLGFRKDSAKKEGN